MWLLTKDLTGLAADSIVRTIIVIRMGSPTDEVFETRSLDGCTQIPRLNPCKTRTLFSVLVCRPVSSVVFHSTKDFHSPPPSTRVVQRKGTWGQRQKYLESQANLVQKNRRTWSNSRSGFTTRFRTFSLSHVLLRPEPQLLWPRGLLLVLFLRQINETSPEPLKGVRGWPYLYGLYGFLNPRKSILD